MGLIPVATLLKNLLTTATHQPIRRNEATRQLQSTVQAVALTVRSISIVECAKKQALSEASMTRFSMPYQRSWKRWNAWLHARFQSDR
ncbi:hypothetical protein N7671_20990, partial [Pseudomonas oleovorans]